MKESVLILKEKNNETLDRLLHAYCLQVLGILET